MYKYKSNRERTRDLLLMYDSRIVPVRPQSAGLAMVYPWENVSLNTLGQWIYTLAANSGYNGTLQEFMTSFGSYLEGNEIIFAAFNEFPETGLTNKLYFDLTEKIIYYWTGTEYLPANAMLIAETILNCGSAAEYID